jgi:hypothetical protein
LTAHLQGVCQKKSALHLSAVLYKAGGEGVSYEKNIKLWTQLGGPFALENFALQFDSDGYSCDLGK